MTARRSFMLLAVPLLAGAMAAGAQNLYKWVDENGRITYSDQPPPKSVTTKSSDPVKVVQPVNPGALRELAKQDTAFRKRQEDAAKQAADQEKKEKAEAARVETCGRARGDLRALRENVPVARMNEQGERVVLDPAARDAESRKLQNFIEETCSNQG